MRLHLGVGSVIGSCDRTAMVGTAAAVEVGDPPCRKNYFCVMYSMVSLFLQEKKKNLIDPFFLNYCVVRPSVENLQAGTNLLNLKYEV